MRCVLQGPAGGEPQRPSAPAPTNGPVRHDAAGAQTRPTAKSAPSNCDEDLQALGTAPRTCLVTDVAGFISSRLLETLLGLGQRVVGPDNSVAGHRHSLADVRAAVGNEAWARFRLHASDIRRLADCRAACQGVDLVLRQAALGSVPRSLADPITTHAVRIHGDLNMVVAARDSQVQRYVYAASSSVYGDHPALPKVEPTIGNPLSPYAVTKLVNDLYAAVFARSYGMASIGLLYVNVFAPRQGADGASAAAVPRWAAAMLQHEAVLIDGDGQNSSDFCFVANAVLTNLLAAALQACRPWLVVDAPQYRDFRTGDVRHPRAGINKAKTRASYAPTHDIDAGMAVVAASYAARQQRTAGSA